MMISLNEVTASTVGTIQRGHLVVVRGDQRLAIVAHDPALIDQYRQTQQTQQLLDAHFLVYLDSRPVLTPARHLDMVCIDLGFPTFRAASGSFSSDHRFSAAGNLAIHDNGVSIICHDDRTGAETWVDIRTGDIRLRQQHDANWYVPSWEMGMSAADGEYQKLFERAPPALAAP